MPESFSGATAQRPRMPNFRRARRGAHHTLDTALRALRRLGLDDARVVVESAGPGWSPGTVVRQEPAPGTVIEARTRVVLGVAGIGALESLPYALRDVDDSSFGVDPLLALFDNPVYKLRHHLRGGGEFFALHAGDPVTARRWIEQVFQLDATRWAPTRWPALARLLPALHRLAGREEGLALALRLVCALPLARVDVVRAMVPVATGRRLALGTANTRLGVDTLLGEGLAEAARLKVTIGPIPLDLYLACDTDAERAERQALYALVLPAHLADVVDERWIVGDPDAPLRLTGTLVPGFGWRDGAEKEGTRLSADAPALGLTTRLGPVPGAAPERGGEGTP